MVIKIKPNSLLLLFYLSMNILLGFYWLVIMRVGGDFEKQNIIIDNIEAYSSIFLGEILLITLFAFSLIILTQRPIFVAKQNNIKPRTWNYISFFVFIIQSFYFLYAIKTGVSVLGSKEDVVDIGPIKFIFTIFNADYIFVIYAFSMKALKRSKNTALLVNTFLFFLSSLYRGWIAGSILSLVLIFIFSDNKVRIRLFYLLILIILFFILAPSIYYVKYVTRGAETLSWEAYFKYYNPETLVLVLTSVLSRFQHISETFVIMSQIDTVSNDYKSGGFVPFLFDNQFRSVLVSKFHIDYRTFGEYAASQILKRESGGNIHTGMLPWLNIDILNSVGYVLFFFLTNILAIYALSYIIPKYAYSTIMMYYFLLYFMHGWFSSYFIVLLSIVEFVFLVVMINRVRFFTSYNKVKL
ncbi:oligosaccharide repeat unit polymerase [Vibrio harveyi]